MYKGKVSFAIDVAVPVEKAFCQDGGIAVWMELQGQGRVMGDVLEGMWVLRRLRNREDMLGWLP